MSEVNVINIKNPFLDQKPGTSGLRKSTLRFQEEPLLRNIYRGNFSITKKFARINFDCWR